MYLPYYESDFTRFAYWVYPPGRKDDHETRARYFARTLMEHPSLAGIQVFGDEASTLERAIEFRRINFISPALSIWGYWEVQLLA